MSIARLATARAASVAIVTAVIVVGSLLTAVPPFAAAPVAASTQTSLEIEGGGWGHGRGLGQYGAEGYSRNFGWSSKQILDHFYSNTTQGPVPGDLSVDAGRMRVDLQFMRGRAMTVALAAGTLAVFGATGEPITQVTTGAVRVRHIGTGFAVSTATSCLGPWSDPDVVATPAVALRSLPAGNLPGSFGAEPDTLMKVCGGGQSTWYSGELRTVVSGGHQRTVNVVSIEEYLRGVVPNEMPASWSDAALQSQVVAARSYALAGDTRWLPWADTCDTIWCQVYDGRYTTRGSSSVRASTHERTDAAIAATEGLVRIRQDGSVARTEFSSSTGGYTAGGEFPAVKDEGDSVSINPNARWAESVSSATLERRFGLGALVGAEVTERNGFGPWGGRVVALRLDFERGSRTLSGDDARRSLGLKSDLFTVKVASVQADGADKQELDRRRAEITLVYERLTGREPTSVELSSSLAAYAADSGAGVELVSNLVRGEEFAGAMVEDMYQRAFGRSPAAAGLEYWRSRLSTATSGRGVDTIGTLFFSSAEFYRRAGGTNEAYVRALYQEVLGRPAAQAGLSHWVDRLESRSSSRTTVAASFFRSAESRRTRAVDLHRRILEANPDRAEALRGAELVASVGDLEVAELYARRLLDQ